MRLPPAILGNAEEVLREILRFMSPADVTLSRYFKDHPRLGGRERGAIAECIYSVLRNKTSSPISAGTGQRPCAAWSCWAWPKPSAPTRWAA
jgi:16S rRNA (cytosine967-C5)-methyltransferase